MNKDKIGYIKISKFSKFTSRDFINSITEMSDNGLKGLIIDLRYNSGGLLRQSINILDALLPADGDNPVLLRKGRKNEKKYYSINAPSIDINIPIIVLQNHRSASASEIGNSKNRFSSDLLKIL